MAVKVTAPEEFMGTIMGDLNSRRGRIEGMDEPCRIAGNPGQWCRLSEIFGYATHALLDPGPGQLFHALYPL